MNSSFMPLQDANSVNGTSFYGDVVFATLNELRYVLGEPVYEQNDGSDKVNMEWNLETHNGSVFTVYDWKEYKSIHPNKQIEWHIGGHSRFDTHLAKQLLSEALILANDELNHTMNFKRMIVKHGDY
jgi:extradiol dioxygenase family protein